MDVLLGNEDCVLLVVYSYRLWAGKPINCITVVVLDHNAEVMFGVNLLYEHVGTVALETIVGSIKGNIMGVSPAIADAFIQRELR